MLHFVDGEALPRSRPTAHGKRMFDAQDVLQKHELQQNTNHCLTAVECKYTQ